MSEIMLYFSFGGRIISLDMISSSIHIVSMTRFHSFLWLSSIPCVDVPHFLYIVDAHYFLFMANASFAAINMDMQKYFWQSDLISLGYRPSSGIVGTWESFIFRFLKNLHTVFYKVNLRIYNTGMNRRIEAIMIFFFVCLFFVFSIIVFKNLSHVTLGVTYNVKQKVELDKLIL